LTIELDKKVEENRELREVNAILVSKMSELESNQLELFDERNLQARSQ